MTGKGWLVLTTMIVTGTLTGCVGPNAYRSVDLDRDLSPQTVARYEREWQELGRPSGMAVLERSNWWPLGLLLYHRDASVMRMPGPDGPAYMITSGTGLGPLAILYAGSTMATFDARGRRLSVMKMHNLLLMHIGMAHESDVILPNGLREQMTSYSLFMHLLNIHTMHGHTYVSLLTVPNPLGATVATGDHDAGHASHAHTSPAAPPAPSGSWTCSMHPQVRRGNAGRCPICAMELVRAAGS